MCDSTLFFPTFHKMDPESGCRCHAPVIATPGDGRTNRQGTSLLNKAGENMVCIGTLGHQTHVQRREKSPLFYYLRNLKGLWRI